MTDPQAAFDQAASLLQGGEFAKAREILDVLAEHITDNAGILGYLGVACAKTGLPGAGTALLSYACALSPDDANLWTNLGATFTGSIQTDLKRKALQRAVKLDPESPGAWCNLAGTYVNEGDPLPGIEAGRRAVALEKPGEGHQSHMNLALLCLEAGLWHEGWKHYDSRRFLNPTHARTYKAPYWQGEAVSSLLLHGEQGLGDEVMFLSALPLVLEHVPGRVVLEVNPKLVPLVRRVTCSARVEVIGGEAEFTGHVDAYGSLGDVYRLFPGDGAPVRNSGYLKPDRARVKWWRNKLAEAGPRPWVAMALHGGVKRTHEIVRNPPRSAWRPVIDAAGHAFSVQYGAERGAKIAEEVGVPHYAVGDDLAELAALVAAADVLVSVPQTALHIGAAVGARVLVAMSNKPAWRYGQTGPMPWYQDNVTLVRMGSDGWQGVMERIAEAVRAC